MGGYGSGGHNKKKGLVERFVRIDSFVDTKIPRYIRTETVRAGIRTSVYYLCPVCGKRVRYLYDIKDHYYFACRNCLNVNYSSQSLPRDERAAIGARQALESIGIDTSDMTPWDVMHYPYSEIIREANGKHDKDIEKYDRNRDIWYDCMKSILGM